MPAYDFAYGTIIGQDIFGRYTVRIDSGVYAGSTAGNLDSRELAVIQGCLRLCVGQAVEVPMYNYADATIVGIEGDGQYIVRLLNGPYAGYTVGDLNEFDLVQDRFGIR